MVGFEVLPDLGPTGRVFSGIIAQADGATPEQFVSDIGGLLPMALCGRIWWGPINVIRLGVDFDSIAHLRAAGAPEVIRLEPANESSPGVLLGAH